MIFLNPEIFEFPDKKYLTSRTHKKFVYTKSTMPSVQHINVSPSESGQKLCSFLMRRIQGLPRSAAMRWIRTGQVRVDSRRCKPFERLESGQTVRVPPHEDFSQTKHADANDPQPLNIIQRHTDYLLINKPSGLAVHGGTGIRDSLDQRLKKLFPEENGFAPTLVHRLDKPTSGAILIARNYAFLKRMHEKWKNNRVSKYYLAWVEGQWRDKKEKRLKDHLSKGRREKMIPDEKGKKAECVATPLRIQKERSLLQIRLITGRTHQIRAQLAMRGHPIIGDRKYGSGGPKRLYLHAAFLDWGDGPVVCPPEWSGAYAVPEGMLNFP